MIEVVIRLLWAALLFILSWPPGAPPAPAEPSPVLLWSEAFGGQPSRSELRSAELRGDPVGCLHNPDRFNWRAYLPPDMPVDESEAVIMAESGGDLCAVNPTSGASCWWQQHPGGAQYLDPAACMAAGHAKWLDGGGSFERHWYRFWRSQ